MSWFTTLPAAALDFKHLFEFLLDVSRSTC